MAAAMIPLAERRLLALHRHIHSSTNPQSPPLAFSALVSADPSPSDGSPVTCTIPLAHETAGTRWGYLEVPDPTIMASSLVPICVIQGAAPGRTALLLAGNHGNEYEGQVALRRLAGTIDPAQVSGRLIIIPTISMDASAGWSREWPDGTNFNRVMPGDPRGNPAQQLAHFLSAVLIASSDIVYDLHSERTPSPPLLDICEVF
jgi:predicted deacylase